MAVQTHGPQVLTRGDPGPADAVGLCTVATRVTFAGTIVQLSGELCYASSPGVRDRILGIAAGGPIRRLDLNGLTFIDLAGVDMLADVLTRIGHPVAPEVWLGARARRLLDLLTRTGERCEVSPGYGRSGSPPRSRSG